jgi:drug/metabolite transporter (DMT)-like permease
MAIMARFAYASGVDTITLLALRFGIAAGILVAVALARGETWPRGKTLATLIGLGALGYGGQAFTFFTALTLAPAGLVALLLYLYPALVAVLSASLLHEHLSAAKLLALAVALVGTVLTIGPASSASPLGVALGIAAAAIYAVYIVAGCRLTARVPPQTMATVVIAAAGAVFFLVATLVRGPAWPRTPAGWLAVLGIAIVSTVAAIVLFFAGLERVGPTRAAMLSTVEPVCTVLLAAVLLGESVAPSQLVGGALILTAVVLLARAAPSG